MTWKHAALGIALAVALVAPALADDTATPGVDRRQENQQDRIGQGVQSGALTPGEAVRLEKEQAAIDRAQGRAGADGVVTPKERARLHRMENRTSRDIYRKKHNRRTAGTADGPGMPGVDRRQANQQRRIGQGVQSGALTPGETIRLEKQQAHIQRAERRAEADGVVTPAERAKLHRKQNRASRNIYRKKHNNRTAQ